MGTSDSLYPIEKSIVHTFYISCVGCMTEWLSACSTHLAVMRENGETDFCLGFVAQWFVRWYSSHAEMLN